MQQHVVIIETNGYMAPGIISDLQNTQIVVSSIKSYEGIKDNLTKEQEKGRVTDIIAVLAEKGELTTLMRSFGEEDTIPQIIAVVPDIQEIQEERQLYRISSVDYGAEGHRFLIGRLTQEGRYNVMMDQNTTF